MVRKLHTVVLAPVVATTTASRLISRSMDGFANEYADDVAGQTPFPTSYTSTLPSAGADNFVRLELNESIHEKLAVFLSAFAPPDTAVPLPATAFLRPKNEHVLRSNAVDPLPGHARTGRARRRLLARAQARDVARRDASGADKADQSSRDASRDDKADQSSTDSADDSHSSVESDASGDVVVTEAQHRLRPESSGSAVPLPASGGQSSYEHVPRSSEHETRRMRDETRTAETCTASSARRARRRRVRDRAFLQRGNSNDVAASVGTCSDDVSGDVVVPEEEAQNRRRPRNKGLNRNGSQRMKVKKVRAIQELEAIQESLVALAPVNYVGRSDLVADLARWHQNWSRMFPGKWFAVPFELRAEALAMSTVSL